MISRVTSSAAALGLAGAAVLAFTGTAAAQEGAGNPGQGSENCGANRPGAYPPGEGPAVSDSTAQPGQPLTADSGCREFAPGQQVRYGVESVYRELGTVIADADGRVSANFTVPTDLAVGQHDVVFRGLGFDLQPNEVRVPFTVVAAAGTGGGAGTGAGTGSGAGTVNVGGVALPRTGSDEIVPLTLLGLGLVGGGAGMVVVARRRAAGVPTA